MSKTSRKTRLLTVIFTIADIMLVAYTKRRERKQREGEENA